MLLASQLVYRFSGCQYFHVITWWRSAGVTYLIPAVLMFKVVPVYKTGLPIPGIINSAKTVLQATGDNIWESGTKILSKDYHYWLLAGNKNLKHTKRIHFRQQRVTAHGTTVIRMEYQIVGWTFSFHTARWSSSAACFPDSLANTSAAIILRL